MVESSKSATEEAGATPIDADLKSAKQPPGAYLERARRILLEEELMHPGAIRLLIADNDRLQELSGELESLLSAHTDLRVKHAALEEKHKKSTLTEIFVTIAVAVGSFGLSQGQRLTGIPNAQDAGWVIMIGCALLIIAAIAAKAWK